MSELDALTAACVDKGLAALDAAQAGARLLVVRARIPAQHREEFIDKATKHLLLAAMSGLTSIEDFTDQRLKRAVYEVEALLRRALKIILSLPPEHRPLFCHVDFSKLPHKDLRACSADGVARSIVGWEGLLQVMVKHIASYTGKSPRVVTHSGRGRNKGDRAKDSYTLRLLLWRLAKEVEAAHGKLTLNRTNESGTWVEALKELQPLFPEIIPKAVPLKMIERLQAGAKKLTR